jgi:hypothetical protein
MIQEVIRPGLANPFCAHYINAFAQTLFHILPLRLMIIARPSFEPTLSDFRAVFADMSQHYLTN